MVRAGITLLDVLRQPPLLTELEGKPLFLPREAPPALAVHAPLGLALAAKRLICAVLQTLELKLELLVDRAPHGVGRVFLGRLGGRGAQSRDEGRVGVCRRCLEGCQWQRQGQAEDQGDRTRVRR